MEYRDWIALDVEGKGFPFLFPRVGNISFVSLLPGTATVI